MDMSNTWFQFRQFKVEQAACAMKVTTDACIQGAWTPLPETVKRVLDIGTGTGLLALMLAQRKHDLTIDAIEYDADAATQAAANFTVSPWSDRINAVHNDIRTYRATGHYDLIICNPPFFTRSLLGDATNRNQARHDVSLNREELLKAVVENMGSNGQFSVLLPHTEYLDWVAPAAEIGLYEMNRLNVRHRSDAPAKRVIGIMTKQHTATPRQQTLTIKNEDGSYSDDFVRLLSPFYLNMPET
jgi:tRNA1Val (adenine37-N6)-methyltransferase